MLRGGEIPTATLPFVIFVSFIAVIYISVVAIFLYKKRKLQRTFVNIAIIINIAAILLKAYYMFFELEFTNFALRTFLPLLNLLFLFLASKGIKRDDDLVKSYDRLR